jgi:hypothetical protein
MGTAPSSAVANKAKKKVSKKTAKKKTTTKKKTTAKTGKDVLVEVSHLVENLTFEKAEELILSEDMSTGLANFRKGGALSVIQGNKWYKDQGYEHFKDYVQDKHNVTYQAANGWINVYLRMIELGVPYKAVEVLGWTRVKVLLGILTKKNMAGWFKKAKAMNVATLKEAVKKAREGSASSVPSGDSPKIHTVALAFHPDQKEVWDEAIASALVDADTEHKSVAATAIAMAYNAGGSSVPASKKGEGDLKKTIKAHTLEEVIEMIETVWPNVDVDATLYESKKAKEQALAEMEDEEEYEED